MEAREGQNSDDAHFCTENTRGAKKNKKEALGAAHHPLKENKETRKYNGMCRQCGNAYGNRRALHRAL